MKTLYLDCVSGISGDMTVAALLDLGVDADTLLEGLKSIGIEGWSVDIRKGMKGVLAGTAFRVSLESGADAQDRSLPEIEALIQGSAITERAKETALTAFRYLGEAEGAVHGIPIDQVHFHEVGAADSIVDIVGAAIGLDLLAPDQVIVSPIPMARGYVRCRHGLIPLPAPATLELAKGMTIRNPPMPTTRELATPTGLAFAKAVAVSFGELPEGVVSRIGYGLGKADFEWPNVLRAVLLETSSSSERGQVIQLEANLDDMTGEALAYALERLLAEGALDAWLTPITMKKGRPGFTLGVLCEPAEGGRIADMMLRETTTLGVRYSILDRTILRREVRMVDTRFGLIRCKVAHAVGASPKVKPEHEDCRRAAEAAGLPLATVVDEVLRAVVDSFGNATKA